MSAETSSKFKKLHKKVKLAIGGSKKVRDAVKTLGSNKKGIRGNRSDEISIQDAVDVSYDNDKLYKKEYSGKRNTKLETKDKRIHNRQDGFEAKRFGGNSGFKSFNSGLKRKRVYADYDKGGERVLHKPIDTHNRKDLSRDRWNKVKDDSSEDRRTGKEKTRGFERSKPRNFSRGEESSFNNESFDKFDGKKSTAKVRATNKVDASTDGGRSSLLKRDTKSKSNLCKQFDPYQNIRPAESLEKLGRKKVQGKKSLDNTVVDDQPRKSKRVIRIDPRDITNKRLDDGIVTNENIKEKKEDLQENDNEEMSKNAQFRAIQPSPYILSFVEDNLLGRRRLIELRRAGYNIELSAPLDNIPSSTSSERERIEEPIFRNKLAFFAAAKISSSFPPPELPEIAFAGRSNVGKSSLLNALTRQWGVVRTSDKPGLTQSINFFELGSKLCLVDLPGYGFAYAKEEVKEAWEDLVKEYVSTRVGLKRVCLLIDTKWGMKPRDNELIELMERSKTNYQIVLTKTDLVFPIDVARRAMQIEESLKSKKSVVSPVMMASSKSGGGIRSLRTVLAKIARFAKL